MLPIVAAAAASATMIFNQSEATAIYSSVGTTVLGSQPYFAVADGLNAPKFAEVYDGKGNIVWSFTNATGDFLVDTARHADAKDNGPVDVFVASCDSTGCVLFGRTSATDSTRWEVTFPGCNTDGGGGTYTGLQASDSGNRVAFLCHFSGGSGGGVTSRVYAVEGQSGKTSWMYDLGAKVKAGQGQVQITASGSHVLFVNEGGIPTPNSATAFVLDGAAGTLIDSIPIPFFITAAISDTGDYVVVGDDPAVHVYKMTGTNYTHAYDLSPPLAGGWIPWDVQISTGPDAAELVVIGYISGDVLTVAVGGFALESGKNTLAWKSTTNPKLQENPTIRADGEFVAVSLWGNQGDVPTVVLLRAGSPTPLFQFVTPGSMFAVDVNVLPPVGGITTVYLAAAGKATPASESPILFFSPPLFFLFSIPLPHSPHPLHPHPHILLTLTP